MPNTNNGAVSDLHELFGKYEKNRDNLIPVLQMVQERLGYISEDAVEAISDYFKISRSEIYGVATFYTQFRFERPGDHIVRICQGTACHVRGGQRIMNEACKCTGVQPGGTSDDYKFSLERVACFGSCALAPVAVIDNEVYGRMSPQKIKQLIEEIE